MTIYWRMAYFLLQFYLFAASGALAYLCARAWFDNNSTGRTLSASWFTSRLANFIRSLAFTAISVVGFVAAVYEEVPTSGIGIGLKLIRGTGFLVLLGILPPKMRKSRLILAGVIAIAIGETILASRHLNLLLHSHGPVVGTALLGIGTTLLGVAFIGALFRLRLVDRLVIAFALFGMLLPLLVGGLFLLLENYIGLPINADQVKLIIDNADRPLVITLSAVLVTSAVIGFFLARDLSAPMTRLERALKAIGEGELDYRVQLRGGGNDELHDLAHEVNRMAHKLKAAESVRAEFFSFVSHELRSPLTAIRGFVETLQNEPRFTESDRREIYDIIHEESDRLLRMIGELLDISRIQAGVPLSLAKQRFEAGRHLDRVAEIMRGHTQKHVLKVEKRNSPVWIEADPDKFDQILINLVSNAIKYSPAGGDVVLSLAEKPDSISIEVTDSGVGMAPEHAAHVFDKFYRVTDADSKTQNQLRRVEGAGIGLYLTRSLVEAHGGTISVTSELGHGSTFTVTLPRVGAYSVGDGGADRPNLRVPRSRPIDLVRPEPAMERVPEPVPPG